MVPSGIRFCAQNPSGGTLTPVEWTLVDVTRQELAAHLARIETSSGFTRAGRLTRFLRYITEEAIAGRAEQLKEYTIAIEVFGRPPSYDPQIDSLVRVQASLLRTRLQQYYSSEGRDEPIRIEIPKGGYEPLFQRTGPPLRRRLRRSAVVAAVAGALAIGGGAWMLLGKLHSGAGHDTPDTPPSVA